MAFPSRTFVDFQGNIPAEWLNAVNQHCLNPDAPDGTFDFINEQTANHGVTVEGVNFKDGLITNPTVPYLDFSISDAPAYQTGRMFWDNVAKAVSYYSEFPGVTNQIGRELWARCRNQTGATIPNGSVVYIVGAGSRIPRIALASATTNTALDVLGVTTMDIPNNSEGMVTVFGAVGDLNTSAWSDGTGLYLSNTPGQLTSTPPSGDSAQIFVALVLDSHVNQGVIGVRIAALPGGPSGTIFGTINVDTINETTPGNGVDIPDLTFQQDGAGTIQRKLQVKVRELGISVNDFSAVALTGAVQNLVFTPGAYTISTNITFTGSVKIENGAILTAAPGVTVAFNGGLEAGRYQIFAGTGTFSGNHKTTAALPEWWGAVAGSSGIDSAPAITKAINFGAAQGCVDLSGSSNAAPYYTATTITATRNNVWLRSVGNNAQIVTTTAANSTSPVFLAGDGVTLYSGFTLENVTFSAQNAASSIRRAVVFNYCSVIKLKNVIIYGTQATRAWYDALWLNSCVQVDIDRTSEISGAVQAGIRMGGASGRKTLDVQCSARIQFNGSGYTIGPYCEGIFDRGSIIFSIDGYCVSINGSAADSASVIKFFGTDFDTCTGAVYADYASNLLFDGCWASGISASAGSVVVLKSTVIRATFDGGRYFGNSGKKLFEVDGDNVGVKNIEGSTCTEFVYASSSASRLQVQNNMIDGISLYAVNKLAGPDKVMITGNDFNGGVISTGGTNLTVANNA